MSGFETPARKVLKACEARGIMLATAESCTGGMIAAALTHIAGSSSVVDRGFVTYSNEAKMEMLGVSPETLANRGAVSRETALEMAAPRRSSPPALMTTDTQPPTTRRISSSRALPARNTRSSGLASPTNELPN